MTDHANGVSRFPQRPEVLPIGMVPVLSPATAARFRAPERAPPPTAAPQQAVRRALSTLQKRGLVVKLGHLFNGERCSYADREHALLIVRKYVRCFGNQALGDHRHLAELYADDIAAEA